MNLIVELKKEFAKLENRNKLKSTVISVLIFAPLLILYAEYWINYVMNTSDYFLSLRPPVEELTNIEITYWIFSSLSILIGGLLTPFILIMYVTDMIMNFISFKMNWKKRRSQCNDCSIRLKENDTILIKNGKGYHYSCFSQSNNITDLQKREDEI